MTTFTLDLLNENSVSVLKQNFDDEGNQIGFNQRNAYANTKEDREYLKEELPEDKYEELLRVWGDTPTIEKPTQPTISIDEVKLNLINAMSNQCNTVITDGFDATLSDGETYHFSLKLEDQLMIQALMLKVSAGETQLPYHADGESCKFFTPEEVSLLYSNMEQIITYNTTYFNSLRDYINSFSEVEDLNKILYGVEIPVEYQSEVLKLLLEVNSNE